jgi:hypothetical protein
MRRTDYSPRGILPTVARRVCDLENLVNEEAIAHVGMQRHVKKKRHNLLIRGLLKRGPTSNLKQFCPALSKANECYLGIYLYWDIMQPPTPEMEPFAIQLREPQI